MDENKRWNYRNEIIFLPNLFIFNYISQNLNFCKEKFMVNKIILYWMGSTKHNFQLLKSTEFQISNNYKIFKNNIT